ncbi:MAG: TrkH family potassium uptake protein [Selenomonadaceae bacterium]|nr:TrkH family potassium uptake protein [Selenomonadaceae bacterium]
MNKRLVTYYLSRLTIGLGLVLIIPTLMAVYHGEGDGIAFVITCGLSLILGINLKSWGSSGVSPLTELSMQDSIGITGLGWLLINLLGTVPYILSGNLGILDGIFETVAGFTGCGGTVFNDLSDLSHSILLWRTLTQWLGGLGIIVIFVALLPQTSQSALQLYQAESSRMSSGRRRPRLREMALVIFKIYLIFTAAASLVYWLVGMTPFAALNHAMTTISTGGFSVYNESIAYYKSPAVEMAVIFFMVLSGGNFNLYYGAYKNGPRVLLRDTEFRTYLGLLAFATVFIAFSLMNAFNYSLTESFREAAFEVAAQDSTGFVAFDYEHWPASAQCVLVLLMLFGGCAGSTTAGLRISRLIMLVKMAVHAVQAAVHPRLHTTVTIDGQRIDDNVLYGVGKFFFLYMFFLGLWTLCYTLDGMSLYDGMGLSLAAMTTVGPGFGMVGATENYANLSNWSKIVTMLAMLMGRLEMFSILALFTPEFWHRERGW